MKIQEIPYLVQESKDVRILIFCHLAARLSGLLEGYFFVKISHIWSICRCFFCLLFAQKCVLHPRYHQFYSNLLFLTRTRLTHTASTDSPSDVLYTIPADSEDKKALLQWAFYESTSLIKRYGDLLEEVNSYLATGTSTVGECVLMLEEEMR